jgi:biotin operon repressor
MEKQVYTRITEKLRKNKDLTPLHKLLIGFLNTYQSNPDGTSTKKYFYDTQENLAEELGVSVRTIKTAIQFLEDKGIIYQTQKSKIDKRPQYKNRKAIILVDKNNPLPSTENKAVEETISTEAISEVQVEVIVPQIKEKSTNEKLLEFKTKWEKNRKGFDYIELCKFDDKFSLTHNPSLYKQDFYRVSIDSFRIGKLSFEEMIEESNKLINIKELT